MRPPVVWVSEERALHVLSADGTSSEVTGIGADAIVWASWGTGRPPATSYTWPTFSPDGQHLAAFEIDAERGAVYVTDLRGERSRVVAELPQQLPIYLQWSQDGERVATVSQLQNDLLLTVASATGKGAARVLAKGSPLFFSWTKEGRLAVFIGGGSANARMMLLDPDQRLPTEVLPGMPGDFCAPVVVGPEVLYGAHLDGRASIVGHGVTDGPRTLPGGEGLMAFVGSPDGRRLARAVARGGDGTPYEGLTVLDIATGDELLLPEMACLAFFWAGDDALVVARVDVDRGLVEWVRVDLEGRVRHLIDLLPSRDLRFYLRFFEQYATSHPIVDAAGDFLLLAGVAKAMGSSPKVIEVPLRGGEPVVIGPGRFACFGPAPAN